jgi:hypothetical protein
MTPIQFPKPAGYDQPTSRPCRWTVTYPLRSVAGGIFSYPPVTQPSRPLRQADLRADRYVSSAATCLGVGRSAPECCSDWPNGSVTQLRGQGPRAEVAAACRLPRIPLDSDTRSATCMTPRRWCSAQGLQPRAEAGPRQLQWQVSQPLHVRQFVISRVLAAANSHEISCPSSHRRGM